MSWRASTRLLFALRGGGGTSRPRVRQDSNVVNTDSYAGAILTVAGGNPDCQGLLLGGPLLVPVTEGGFIAMAAALGRAGHVVQKAVYFIPLCSRQIRSLRLQSAFARGPARGRMVVARPDPRMLRSSPRLMMKTWCHRSRGHFTRGGVALEGW